MLPAWLSDLLGLVTVVGVVFAIVVGLRRSKRKVASEAFAAGEASIRAQLGQSVVLNLNQSRNGSDASSEWPPDVLAAAHRIVAADSPSAIGAGDGMLDDSGGVLDELRPLGDARRLPSVGVPPRLHLVHRHRDSRSVDVEAVNDSDGFYGA